MLFCVAVSEVGTKGLGETHRLPTGPDGVTTQQQHNNNNNNNNNNIIAVGTYNSIARNYV
jgi:hypothetical protein